MSPLICLAVLKRYTWLLVCLGFVFIKSAHASTVLFNHTGAANPTTEGWTTSGSSENGAIVDDLGTGIDAWKVIEQGGANSRTYNQTLTTTQLSDALLTGWTLDATIRFVPPDPLASTALSNNAWCTFLVDEGVAGSRDLYGIYFGCDVDGNTLVRLYSTGATYTLTPGYHDYSLVWDPVTQLASFFIDGELKVSDYVGSTITNSGTSRVYWGDNTTTNATTERGAHYSYVGFSIGTAAAPEPNKILLLGVALVAVVTRRRRPC